MPWQKLYPSAAALDKAVEAYFNDCDASGTFPDEAGMLLALDISETTMRRYAEAEGYGAVIARARARRESWLVRKMVTDNKVAQGCLNALKQDKNGGYIDRQYDPGPRELTINIRGVGDGAFT